MKQKPETSTQQQTKITVSRYDFAECLIFLEKSGKEMFGDHFTISPHDHAIIFKLMVYFFKDKTHADNLGISFRKGILLTGPIGCGKTSLMTLMRTFLSTEDQYTMKPCRDVSFEFIKDGYSIIHKYANQSFTQSALPKAYCFDDLGVEQNLKYFGNECNVMAEILLGRYDLFISNKMLTHITTNLSANEIETNYGNRIRSRLREMLNLIAYEADSKDKRK